MKLVGFTEYGVIVTQGLNEVYLEGLDISGCGYGGVIIIKYWDNELLGFYWIGSTSIANNNAVLENDLDFSGLSLTMVKLLQKPSLYVGASFTRLISLLF
ncbi:MAG: hypothetical protein QXL69_06225 [Candidatus Bathyarchaeia archaeon]